ncbi:MAG: MBL fold metallo-hydrolase [Halobacteriota archaeon]
MAVQLTPDVLWINESYEVRDGEYVHVAVYLISESDSTILVDTGSFYHRDAITAQIEEATDRVDSIILSHGDAPHGGNLHAFNNTWDDIQLVSAAGTPEIQGYPTTDYRRCRIGEDMIVEGRRFSFIDPPLADRNHTVWIYDHGSKVLVTADGFGNHHTEDESDLTSGDFDDGIDTARIHDFHRDALRWLRFVDPEKLRVSLESIFDAYDISYVAPIHGNPIASDDIETYMDRLMDSVGEIRDSR